MKKKKITARISRIIFCARKDEWFWKSARRSYPRNMLTLWQKEKLLQNKWESGGVYHVDYNFNSGHLRVAKEELRQIAECIKYEQWQRKCAHRCKEWMSKTHQRACPVTYTCQIKMKRSLSLTPTRYLIKDLSHIVGVNLVNLENVHIWHQLYKTNTCHFMGKQFFLF